MAVYGSATPGPMSDYTIGAVADQATSRSKGHQGILIIGTLLPKYQHYKAEYRDLLREAVIMTKGNSEDAREMGLAQRPLHDQGHRACGLATTTIQFKTTRFLADDVALLGTSS